jgi:hypothetical protein
MSYGKIKANSLIYNTGGADQEFLLSNMPTPASITQSVKTEEATWTAVSQASTVAARAKYLANTAASAFTLTLPASPVTGDYVVIADAAGTFATSNLTVGRNGSNIDGLAENLVCDVSRAYITLVFSGNATTGWLIK